MTTWFIYNIGFYKICMSKTCHFWMIMQITPYSISNNYKLFMVAFNITLQMETNCMEAPSMCARHVEQFFVPLDLGHTCYGLVSQMTSWLNYPQHICISIITPYDIYQHAQWICFKPQSCDVLFGHLLKGICNSWLIVNKKLLWGNPQMHFLCIGGILLLS
jgi:hypothetical protein